MKTLWAPWRMEHVLGAAPQISGGLIEPPRGEPSDRAHLLLFRVALSVVLLNRFSYANGHLLLAPKRHLGDLTKLDAQGNLHFMTMLSACCTILRQRPHPHGINIAHNLGKTAGDGIIDHLHFHLVPRWKNDHNFMTVCAVIRTIPQHIDQTVDLLLPDFLNLLTPPAP